MQNTMAPVKRAPARPAAQSRRQAPAQQRRTAATRPARPVEEEEESTPFDAQAGDEEESFLENEGELPEIIDLSDVEATTYEVIPRGIYEGYVDSVEYGICQSKNLPMLTWTLKFD